MGLKEIYYSMEEKWYGFWDKVDAHIPIYKIIDPIDSVIPSLVLFLVLIILLLAFGVFFFLSLNQVYDAKFTIVSNNNEPINDSLITVKIFEGDSFREESARTDAAGEIIFSEIKKGSRISFDINLSKGTYKDSFTINKDVEERIKLKAPQIILSPVTKKIYTRLATGKVLTQEVEIKFSCEGSNTLVPTPMSATTTGEEVQVTEPVGCLLKATINDPKYIPKSYYINSLIYDLFLEQPEPPTVKLNVKIREGGYIVGGKNFKVKASGNLVYDTTTSSSEAILNVTAGNYTLTITDPSGDYGLVSRNIDVQKDTETTIEVSREIKAKVTINVKDDTTNRAISDAIINVKNSNGREIYSTTTNENGTAIVTFIDLGEYTFTAKKLGDLNGGYFSSSATITVNADANLNLGLEKITKANLGRVKVIVKDQDNTPVMNARVMLKYVENEGIVELMQEKNYSLTDVNGETTFLAGKVNGRVYAYAIKSPFNGSSMPKTISIEGETEFNIKMEVGSSTIKINLFDETGEKIDGTAKILTIDGLSDHQNGLAGIISVEGGTATRSVKAGQTIYILAQAEGHNNYYSVPTMLWPNKTYTFDLTLKKDILEPSIEFDKIYNDSGTPVNTLAPGKKYYARLFINSDQEYEKLIMHFRAGKEVMMDNDVVAIDYVEAANVIAETRGTTFNKEEGYSYDFLGLTSGLAKWVNLGWENIEESTREVKVWFKVSPTASPTKEIIFYYRAEFDETRKPASEEEVKLYSDTYQTNVYYVGNESTCETEFCANNEWLYSQKEELFIVPPYSLKQVSAYNYHLTLLNNSIYDYGREGKKIYLSISVVGDKAKERRIRINNYRIRDSLNTLTNNTPIYSADNLEITNFEKNSIIDINLGLEGVKEGGEIIKFELKSEGVIIYTKEVDLEVVKEKDFTAKISPQFIPALINTQIEVIVLDEEQIYLPGATVNSYAKEPGFEEYLVSSTTTDRMGKAIVDSGALFDKATVIIEIIKEGYSRKRYATSVSEQTVAIKPTEILVNLNPITKREDLKHVTLANLTKQPLIIKSISIDAKYKDVINEDAMNAYFDSLTSEEKKIKPEDTLEIDLIKIRLANGITSDNMIEPVSIDGTIKMVFEEPKLKMLYYLDVPIRINVSTDANPATECLVIRPTGKTSLTTEKAQVRFDFELINACEVEKINIELDGLSVISTSDLQGIAEISLSSTTGTATGRTALDGSKREVVKTVPAGAKMYGVITYAPNEEAIGKSITIPISFEAKFQNQTVKSDPSTTTFTANVINLKECMAISSNAGANNFDERAKITIDATKCLGQTIDIILCRNDSGCSGGAEGKITLSKKAFTIKNKSEEVEVYAPSIPGTYGVTVHARTRGNLGFDYIGEIPVTFIEQENRIFKLNKYELLLQGEGAQDAILLENNMLTQDVRVKANGCVWGVKSPSTDWMKVMTGAMIGATIGGLIGKGFQTEHPVKDAGKDTKADKTPTTQTKPVDDVAKTTTPAPTDNDTKGWWTSTKEWIANKWDGSWLQTGWKYTGGAVWDGLTWTGGKIWDGLTWTYDNTIGAGWDWVTGKNKVEPTGATGLPMSEEDFEYYGMGGQYDDLGNTSPISVLSVGETTDAGTPALRQVRYFNPEMAESHGLTISNNYDYAISVEESRLFPGYYEIYSVPYGEGAISREGFTTNPSGTDFYTYEELYKVVPCDTWETSPPKVEQKAKTASFSVWAGHQQGWFTLAGAVIGGVLAYMDQDFDCSDPQYDQIINYTDFVINLQGGENTISDVKGEPIQKDIPSDAGALTFSLGEINPEWDFSDAYYSGTENVAIRFTNNGLDDPTPRYGTLTVNATRHIHGYDPAAVSSGMTSGSSTKYDVECKKDTFANYNIGSTPDEGQCSGVSEHNYSQKFHVRVISSDPKGEEAYTRKYSSCYMGSLTGSTGEEALPRIKLDWDWDSIKADSCDYGNPNYIYCDGTQFLIALTKKLANLDEFLMANGSGFNCPPSPIEKEVQETIDAINNSKSNIMQGTIGVSDIQIRVENDTAQAIITVKNLTEAPQETMISYAWKGEGLAASGMQEFTAQVGETTLTFDSQITKYDGIYYFTAVVNGEKGDRYPLSRAFLNPEEEDSCWVEQSTTRTGGVPSLFYYVDGKDTETPGSVNYTNSIRNISDLYKNINFAVYLTRESFTEDFFNDFKEFYRQKFLQKLNVDPTQSAIVDYLSSGNFKITKKFSGDTTIEPGLYEVYVNIDSPDQFRVIDGDNTKIEIQLLLVKTPSVDSPFYRIPFDGMLGEGGNGRQGYGSTYNNLDTDAGGINISNNGFGVYTFDSAMSNGITTLQTTTKSTFEEVNVAPGTRGQIAAVSVSNNTATMKLAPIYVTPVIGRVTISDSTEGKMAYSIETNNKALITGGNISYWTGAAKTRNFYGGNAIDTYQDSPDYRMNKLGDNVYGFEFKDISHNGTMLLKTLYFTPVENNLYILKSIENSATFWTPNNEFSPHVQLGGINGMTYNDISSNSRIESLQNLFDAVKEGKVCVSNDGSSTSFWWNPAIAENVSGANPSMAEKELELLGTK